MHGFGLCEEPSTRKACDFWSSAQHASTPILSFPHPSLPPLIHPPRAALSLGAAGINMGTRFMATVEAPIHMNVKRAIVAADEHSTTLILRRWRNTSRMFSNSQTAQTVEIEKTSPTGEFKEVAELVSGKRGREVLEKGDVEQGGVSLPYVFDWCFPKLLLTASIGLVCGAGDGVDSRHPHV